MVGDEHKKSTTSDHSHPQRYSTGRLINSPISPFEMKSIFHSRLIVSGGGVPLSMNTYIRTHSSSTCTIFITIFLVAFVVVMRLNLFYMDANENIRRRTDIPSWIDDASSLEKIQVRFASRSTCLAWTISRSSTRSKWHIRTMNTSTRSVRRPSMISVTGPVSLLLRGHRNIPFLVDAICDLEYIERKRKLPADLEVLSMWVNQTDSKSKNPSFF